MNLYKKFTKKGTNRPAHPQEYMVMRQEVDRTEQYVIKAIKLAKKYCDANEKSNAQLRDLGEFFNESSKQDHGEFADCLRWIGNVCVNLSTIRQNQLLNVVFVQPCMKYLSEFEEGSKLHKKYIKKEEQYRSQEEALNLLMQKEKKDPNRIQQEEEKLKLLETARDQIFEEVHQYTIEQISHKYTRHLSELLELYSTFRTLFSEGSVLIEDIKPYLDKLQGESVERIHKLKTKNHHPSSVSTSDGWVNIGSRESSPRDNIHHEDIHTDHSFDENEHFVNKAESNKHGEYLATHNFEAQNDDEINLCEGDVIYVYNKEDNDWWLGYTKREKRIGYFPRSHCINKVRKKDLKETIALYDFIGDGILGEIDLKQGDTVQIKEMRDDGWWLGMNIRTKQTGRFPFNYTKASVD